MKGYCLDTYNEITPTATATMLAKEDYLTETHTIQISSCHAPTLVSFTVEHILETFLEAEHLLPPNTYGKFESDYYTRIRISTENRPIELPDKDNTLLSDYATVVGKTSTQELNTTTNTLQMKHEYTNA